MTTSPACACAAVIVDELIRHGVRHAVVCPGSRSAPLAFAWWEAAVAGRVEVHVRTDERAAGFLALGLAKRGVPVPVVTTSGTAVANLTPALLEAAHSGVPVIAITADRPPELRGTGANQTTHQVGLFGSIVRWHHDLGVPDERPGQVPQWRAMVSRAFAAALGCSARTVGPVHVNVPFREPLVPGPGTFNEALSGRPGGLPWTAVAPVTQPGPLIPDLDDDRTIMVVGDVPGGPIDWGIAAARLARRQGWPVVAEPSSGGAWQASIPHGALILGAPEWLSQHQPRRVLVVGRVTLSRTVSAVLKDPSIQVDVVADGGTGGWPDPLAVAREVLPWEALLAPRDGSNLSPVVVDAKAPNSREEERVPTSPWLASWKIAGRQVANAVDHLIADRWPSGPSLARAMLAALSPEATLFIGPSNPIRDVMVAVAPSPSHPRMIANRGLAGIDGCVSTASGLALASSGPSYALLGDLTFLHDFTGLIVGPQERHPDLTVVVADDNGGGIFHLVEPGDPQHDATFERMFGTPHGKDIAALTSAAGISTMNITSSAQLVGALREIPSGIRVLQVSYSRTEHRLWRTELNDVTGQALRSLLISADS
ncbi:MAG: 2-succinyl-5-enolpyruvyl-6-hydroxy-3-cyclohexene-1-carboxylic-acid synthase [Actinomycetota bacterium]